MYRLDGWLDPAGGAALKSALESLSRPLGAGDRRTSKQRRADSLVELVHHAMDRGTLPRRNGVRPHVSVHTTIEGLKGELGAAAGHLEGGMPISNKTVQRLACDGSLHRVLKADSMVIDVGRAKRTAQPAQGSPPDHGAGAPAGAPPDLRCPRLRPADRDDQRPPRRLLGSGGHTNLRKMIPLCYHHHRLVHEGGYQVVLAGERVEFIPPDRPAMTRRRWGESRWAA